MRDLGNYVVCGTGTSADGLPFIDIVVLFAANINLAAGGTPPNDAILDILDSNLGKTGSIAWLAPGLKTDDERARRRRDACAPSSQTRGDVSGLKTDYERTRSRRDACAPSSQQGLHCAPALIDDKPMFGTWYDRALEYEVHRQAERKAARNATPVEPVKRGDFMTPYELKLAPLPCWRNLPTAEIPKRVAQLVTEIEATAAEMCEERGTPIVAWRRSAIRMLLNAHRKARTRQSRYATRRARGCASARQSMDFLARRARWRAR